MLLGRDSELELLEEYYAQSKSQLVVLYGRRRIGKSFLVEFFSKNKPHLFFEGLEEESTQEQINNFVQQLKTQIEKDFLLSNLTFTNWHDLFYYLTIEIFPRYLGKKKLVLFFDELQWMAAGRSRLISLIKYFWDNHWKDKGLMLILCGSLASFMVDKVINSKALYGRASLHLHLKGLLPNDARRFFRGKRSKQEILKYLMILGTVPKYLELIDCNQSFAANMNTLCFSEHGYLFDEIEKIFYKQFREAQVYLQIVKHCKDKALTMKALAHKLKQKSNGGLKRYITNLCEADILQEYVSFGLKTNTKDKRYKVMDEYILFYFKYIEPNKTVIKQSQSRRLFQELCEKHWDSWLGFAFERFCMKNIGHISRCLGFADEIIEMGPLLIKGQDGFQIDYLLKRSDDVIVLCEIKYSHNPIGTEVIAEIERKLLLLQKYSRYTIERALITVNGINNALAETRYFHHVVDLEDLLG